MAQTAKDQSDPKWTKVLQSDQNSRSCPKLPKLDQNGPKWLNVNQLKFPSSLIGWIKELLSVKYVFLISQETNGRIVILKTVLKSDLWPGSEKCGSNPKFEDNNLKPGHYRVPKLPPLSVKYICPISRETNHPITIPKIVLKSVLWRGSESAQYFCIFQL